MIHFVEGDILKSKAQAIVHGVAPGDPFNQGLALALRQRWPALYQDFRSYCHQSHPKEGDLWTWGGTDGIRVIQLLTQSPAPAHSHANPGKASLPNVNHALKALRKEIENEKFTSVALPRIATGVGGLSWEEVAPLIDKHLGDLKVPIILYSVYAPGVAAKEPV